MGEDNMKLIKIFFVLVLSLTLILGFSAITQARVMLTASVNNFSFSILSTATFTMDDWLSNPNLWILTIQSDKTVSNMQIEVYISSNQFNPIASGTVTVIGRKGFQDELLAGMSFYLNNTMVQEGKKQVDGGDFSEEFVDEVMRIGFLPEGWYYLRFSVIGGTYSDGTGFSGDDDFQVAEEEIEIKNPSPPELMTPEDMSDDAYSIPHFTWQRPVVSDLTRVSAAGIQIFYDIKLWKMFEDNGTPIVEEDAITRIPIWSVENLPTESADFDPGTAREELMVGRKYCWQIQAFDGLGRFISQTNEGKSDVWDFTVQFEGPEIGEPILASLTVNWTPAQAGGALVYYTVSIADNPDYSDAYVQDGIVMTTFTYPDDEQPLQRGITYYFQVQTTDENISSIGEPDQITFVLPSIEVELASPDDGTVLPTNTPAFTWSGNGMYYVAAIYDEESDWTYSSVSVRGTRWVYDGEPLNRGSGYMWNVTPTNQFGDQIGNASETWRFTLPVEGQATLVSPVNETVDTVFPTFVWDEIPVEGDEEVSYNLVIMDNNENVIHTASVTETQYQYPQDAEMLRYIAKYSWNIMAEIGGTEADTQSSSAWFTTPFIIPEGETITLEEAGEALKMVLSDYPEFAEFEDKVLQSINDESGPITPTQLIEFINTFRILSVSAE